jgi:predicted nucleic acid-binding protein
VPGVTVDSSVWVAAADPSDPACPASRSFFADLVRRGSRIHAPAFARVEIGCALARRIRDAAAARRLAHAMLAGAQVADVAIDTALLARALHAGTAAFLRGADSLFVATAQAMEAALVSWDDELLRRGGAVTPSDWAAANP